MENNLPTGGILLLDKESGYSSHYLVNYIKRCLGKKTGHGGTLDPLACGLLIIAFGNATRLLEYALDSEKEYIFRIKWGSATDSFDSEGQVTETSTKVPTLEEIEKTLPLFTGTISQTPPIFSAIKIGGKPAYELARKGLTPTLKERKIEIKKLEILEHNLTHTSFRVFCSKGTYIRSLANDISTRLNCLGHVDFLKRTFASGFNIDNAFKLKCDKSDEDKTKITKNILPGEYLLSHLEQLNLNESEAEDLVHGKTIKRNNLQFEKETFMRAKFRDELIGIVRVDKDTIYPRKILFNHLIFNK